MYHLRILSIGKTKEAWLDEACSEYIKRLTHRMSVDFVWLKTDQQLIAALAKENNVLCLDPAGKMMESEKFAKYIEKSFEKGGTHLTIAIGGPEGLPEEVRSFIPSYKSFFPYDDTSDRSHRPAGAAIPRYGNPCRIALSQVS